MAHLLRRLDRRVTLNKTGVYFMTHQARALMSISLLMIGFQTAHAISYYSIRSQSVNAAREYVGWQQYIFIPDQDRFYGSANLTFEYSRSFRANDITRSLFQNSIVGFNDCGGYINVSGSTVANRGKRDWLADYFGLPTDFQSTLQFKPTIDNYILDFNFFFGFDEFVPGLFFRFHIPVVHTRWDLNFTETIQNSGSNNGSYPAGYFTPALVTLNNMLPSVTSYMNGNKPSLNSNTKYDELTASRFSTDCGSLTETGVAEIQAILGYSLTNSDEYHCSIGLRVAAPTGTRPNATYLFKPIVGNGKHWEIGGNLTGAYTFWHSMDDHSHASIQTVANVTHMFNAHQTRSFDLCGEPNSRYMLAEKMSTPVSNDLGSGYSDPALYQFQNEFAPVANVTQSDVSVAIGVQADVLLAVTCITNNFSIDIGYNFWGRTCEKIELRDGCAPDNLNGRTWALKGDAFVFGFENGNPMMPIALSATERYATIHAGTNGSLDGENAMIDNALPATGDLDNMGRAFPLYAANMTPPDVYPYNQTNTSIQPITIKETDLDLNGTKALSNKFFAHVSYSWLECEDWTPYLGIGGEVELGKNGCDDRSPIIAQVPPSGNTKCCGECIESSTCFWGVWVKGGFTFN
jgi:hypothetical protein